MNLKYKPLRAGFLAMFLSASSTSSGSAEAQSSTAGHTAREAGAIISGRVAQMWVQPESAPAVGPRIRIKLNRDGTLNGVPEVDNPSDDPAFTAYAKSAIGAVLRAAPFDLAAYSSSYDQWKTVVLPFGAGGDAAAGSGGAATAGMTTTANFSPAYKQDGNAINSLTLFKPMADGNPVLALAFCGAGDMEGTFALGVDFGKGMVWDQPEPVLVTFGRHRETHSMKVMREYLGFDGDEARSAISELVQSTGSLTFSGPRGLSVSFDLAGAQGALAQLKKHCGI